MKVRHPQYGGGVVKSLTGQTATDRSPLSTSSSKTRTTSSEPAAKAAQLLQSLRKVTAAKFCEPFNRVRDLFVD
jgi:hypothetical protein